MPAQLLQELCEYPAQLPHIVRMQVAMPGDANDEG
jgi:hypothetical protein